MGKLANPTGGDSLVSGRGGKGGIHHLNFERTKGKK